MFKDINIYNASKAPPLTIERYLQGTPFPVNKRDLIAQVEGNEAPVDVLKVLNGFEEKVYASAVDVSTIFNHLQTSH